MATLPRCALTAAGGSFASFSPALTGWTNSSAGPSGTAPASGDFVLLVGTTATASQTVTQTAGTGTWTIQASDNNAGPGALTVFVAYRIFNGTETTPTFSWATSGRTTWVATAFAPAAGQTLSVDVWATPTIDTSVSTTHTAGAATASGTDTSVILSGAIANAGATNPVTFSGPAGWTSTGSNTEVTTSRAQSSGMCYQASVTGTVTPGAQTIEGGTTTTTATAANLYHVLIATSGGSQTVSLPVATAATAAPLVTPLAGATVTLPVAAAALAAPVLAASVAVQLPVATQALAAPLPALMAGATVALPVTATALAAPLVSPSAAGGPPALEAGSSYVTTGTSTVTAALAFTIPSGTQAGDIIVIVAAMGFATPTWSSGSGGTAFTAAPVATGTNGALQVLTHTYTGSEGWTPGTTTVTVTATATHPWCGWIGSVTGTTGPDPALTSGRINAPSATIAVSGVTTTQAPDLLLWFGMEEYASGVIPVAEIGVASGITPLGTQAKTTASSTINCGLLGGTGAASTAGATGAKNGTLSGPTRTNGGVLLSFGPASIPQTVTLPVATAATAAPAVTPAASAAVALPVAALALGAPLIVPGHAVSLPTATASLAAPVVTPAASARVALPVAAVTLGAPLLSAGSPVAVVINEWAASFATPPVFGPSPPGIQSLVVSLTSADSVGSGSGTPTAGNWLFVSVGWNQAAGMPPVTIGVGDDTHQWNRPNVPSASSGNTRTTIWYQPNIIPPQSIYVSPSGYTDGMTVLVTEVSGLGIWDQVTTVVTNYATGATSLPLAAGAPGAAAFMIASGTGDLSTAGTALTHAGWTPLQTVTAANGTDHTGDTILASACIATGSAQTVNVTASSGEDLSGMILSVLASGPSPVPGGLNPSWPYVKYEAGFGSGYLTPPDQITWTDLLLFANGNRLRSWDETTGPQYELDALESSEVGTALDNPDGALSPFNPSSPWYPDILPGTPMRIRAIAPGGTRWHVISRNAETWPQTWDDLIRGESNAKLTDLWSICTRPCPTPYRAELLNDLPYAWWPMDDSGVNNATTLVNAAPGNVNPLQILASPNGLSVSGTYGGIPSTTTTYSALQAFEQNSGWMYGDPVSASWQETGNGGPASGWYLSCNDTNFPPISAGITIEYWGNFNFALTGSGSVNSSGQGPIGQPSGALALWQVSTASAPLVLLSLNSSGHLQIDYGGTTTVIYSGADLRNTTWMGVTVTLTQTGWTATLNGGLAAASGSGSIGSAWQYLTVNGGTGSSGGGTASAITGIGNAAIAHVAVYPSVLPAGRILSHFMAAYTAFGQLPAPSASAQMLSGDASTGGNVYGPDGIAHALTLSPGATVNAFVTAALGGYTSATSTPEAFSVFSAQNPGTTTAYGWVSATGLAPEYAFYTSSGAGAEKLASATPSGYLYVPSFGTGASPPAAASALGDGAGQRIERYLQAGGVTVPARCIDPSPTAIVAGLDSGGQASGSNIANITASDSSFLFIDNMNMLCCWDRPHLDGQNPIWQLGDGNGQIPYYLAASAQANADPQRIFNDIAITQYDASQAAAAAEAGDSTGSGETSGGLVYAPDATRYTAVKASQLQNGYQPLQNGTTSYLQAGAEIQAQANWLFDQFGQVQQRIENLEVHAENNPASWDFILGINTGDLIEVFFDPPGQPTFSGTFRATRIARKIEFTGDSVEGSVTLIADYEPSSYFS